MEKKKMPLQSLQPLVKGFFCLKKGYKKVYKKGFFHLGKVFDKHIIQLYFSGILKQVIIR